MKDFDAHRVTLWILTNLIQIVMTFLVFIGSVASGILETTLTGAPIKRPNSKLERLTIRLIAVIGMSLLGSSAYSLWPENWKVGAFLFLSIVGGMGAEALLVFMFNSLRNSDVFLAGIGTLVRNITAVYTAYRQVRGQQAPPDAPDPAQDLKTPKQDDTGSH